MGIPKQLGWYHYTEIIPHFFTESGEVKFYILWVEIFWNAKYRSKSCGQSSKNKSLMDQSSE